MGENKIGQFIAKLRKEKQMTQRELAEQLHITDKAVSKWERGLSCPDISLLTSLAGILGVTTSELLNGKKNKMNSNDVEQTVDNTLSYAENSVKYKLVSIQNILAIIFSILLLLAIIVCTICDITVAGKFTWALYPISSIIFTWLIFIPIIKSGKGGLLGSLIMLSIFIIPFLFVMDKIIGGTFIIPIGIIISIFSIIYLWCVCLILTKMKSKKLLGAGFSLLLSIPLHLAINSVISKFFFQPIFDIWDILSFAVIILTAAVLFAINHVFNNNRN